MNLSVYYARFYLYYSLLLWSLLLFALSIARLSYTTHIPRGDPLNGGRNFYDPSVAALLATSILSLLYTPFILWVLRTEWMHRVITLVYTEVAAASVLWIVLLGSTAAATNVWPDLSFCVQFRACTNLQAMIAFGWLAWISLSLILLITVVSAYRSQAWKEHVHGLWSDRPVFWGGSGLPTPDYEGTASRSRSNASRVSRSNVSAPQMRSMDEV